MGVLERLGGLSPSLQRALLLLGCALLFALWPRWVPLVEVDETRYAEATREMLESRSYIVPQFNYAPRYQKPILFYWLQCASVKALGPGEAAARAPSALLGAALVLLIHACLLGWLAAVARESGAAKPAAAAGAAFLGSIALATTPLIAIWTRAGVTDVTLTFFIVGALAAQLQAALHPDRARLWYPLSAASAGLAFLTKGPMGALIPAVVWLAYHAREGSLRQEWRRVPWLLAAPAFLLPAAPWYVAITLADGPAFVRQFFLWENLGRFAGAGALPGMGAPSRLASLLGYAGLVLLLLFPHGVFALREVLVPFSERDALVRSGTARRVRRFAVAWAVAVLVLFAPSYIHYPNYVQSAAGAVAILFALHLLGRLAPQPAAARSPAPWRSRVLEPLLLTLTGAAWIGVMAAVLLRGSAGRRPWDQPFPPAEAAWMLAVVVALGALMAWVSASGYRRSRPDRLLFGVTGVWCLVAGALLFSIAPMIARSSFAPPAEAGEYLRSLPRSRPALAYLPRPPEILIYYGRRRVDLVDSRSPRSLAMVRRALAASGEVILITDDAGLALARPLGRLEVLRRFDYFTVARLARSD